MMLKNITRKTFRLMVLLMKPLRQKLMNRKKQIIQKRKRKKRKKRKK